MPRTVFTGLLFSLLTIFLVAGCGEENGDDGYYVKFKIGDEQKEFRYGFQSIQNDVAMGCAVGPESTLIYGFAEARVTNTSGAPKNGIGIIIASNVADTYNDDNSNVFCSINSNAYSVSNFQIIVNKIGAVGDTIEGTFTVSWVSNKETGSVSSISEGSFRVLHIGTNELSFL